MSSILKVAAGPNLDANTARQLIENKTVPEQTPVEALTTHPDKQRQGVATSLMQIAEVYARQHRAECVGLSVGVDNGPAQALYRKLAYQPTELPPYSVTWNYLDKTTGEVKVDGELCDFWRKSLD
jgi:GNAT superfamily N-acetyltransferase